MQVKKLKRKLQTGTAVVFLAMSAPVMASAETLADAMADAYTNSGLLHQYRAVLRAADEDVAVAVSSMRPVLNWAADVTRSFGRAYTASTILGPVDSSSTSTSLGLAAELVIYDGGDTKLRVEAAKESVLATRQALVGVEQDILLQAVDAYTSVRTQIETVALRENNVRVIGEELRAARDRFEVGEVTRTDVAQAEARLAAARSALAQAQGNLTAAREYFNAAVGRKAGRLSAPPTAPATARTVDAAKALALRAHPDLLKAQHEAAAADLAVAIAAASIQPRVTLNGTYGIQETFDSRNFSKGGTVGIEVSGPIYAGGKIPALYRQAMANREAARANLHVVGITLAQNVGTSYAQLQVARAAREASNQQVSASRVAFRGVREEATLGARTTLDVLNAEQELLDAQANLITATASEYLASYSLLSAMGLLTAEHLNLKVQRYDAAAYFNQVKDAPVAVSERGRKLDKVLRGLGKE
ncbi:TolC family outer membrane protein [Thalassovita taeanensis]|uniref:Outer membrane protein n=1 Tax=Thalassovita taeanensis TaxID=657014 RepID=A0A1H9FBN1_9RHOB|nr:TolC family outer membrane protein [Thalassovita taeanensis]SEQ35307.1 outer membrane protein [Thalassovita taeanensis]